jgi:hypothetical protein
MPTSSGSKERRVPFLILAAITVLAVSLTFGQAIPKPEEFFGHQIGAEKKLARWDKIVDYMKLAAMNSDRVLLLEPGRTTDDNTFLLLVISSPSNLKNLDRYRDINRRLFDPRMISSDEEARRLAAEGRIFVLITCSMHASEVGATQMSIEAVHRLATENSPEVQSILDNVVLLLVPSLNPDGQIMVTDWYNETLGTPHENAPMPWLYHRYVGHDNNRDAYMFTQKESRIIGKICFQEWLPQVWLDMHQMGSNGARIFVMPADDPINPNVDPLVYRNTGLLGYAQGAALERAGKEGIVNSSMYTYFWEGAMGWAGWWHNQLGMLTEVASVRTATSIEQRMADPNAPPPAGSGTEGRRETGRGARAEAGGLMAPPRDVQFRAQYPRPWLGGKWTLRDIVDYDFIAAFGLLDAAARLRSKLLEDLYTIGKRQVEMGKKGDPYAVVIRPDQADRPTTVKLLQTLAYGGVEVHEARSEFKAGDAAYPAGSYVILMAQPFRPYAKDMLEAQDYPKISPAPGVPARAPYDAAGWSLGMQMGVKTDFIAKPFTADLAKLDEIPLPPGKISGTGPAYMISHEPTNSLVAVNRFLEKGLEVSWLREAVKAGGRDFAPGAIVVKGRGAATVVAAAVKDLGIDAVAAAPPAAKSMRIRAPRTALYQPWGGNMDEGWTRWVLEDNEFPYMTVHPEDLRQASWSKKFDCVIFPDMSSGQIVQGLAGQNVPEKYRGGIGDTGLEALKSFIAGGGTVIALGRSVTLFMDRLGAPVGNALEGVGRNDFICPGSIVRIRVDNTHPLGYGMKAETDAYFSNSMVLDPVSSFADMSVKFVALYPEKDILRSGWLQGESYLAGKGAVAEVRSGKGRMIMLPTKVLNRAQAHGTFKLLFNAILTSAAE